MIVTDEDTATATVATIADRRQAHTARPTRGTTPSRAVTSNRLHSATRDTTATDHLHRRTTATDRRLRDSIMGDRLSSRDHRLRLPHHEMETTGWH